MPRQEHTYTRRGDTVIFSQRVELPAERCLMSSEHIHLLNDEAPFVGDTKDCPICALDAHREAILCR